MAPYRRGGGRSTTSRQLVNQRAAQRAALNRPDLSRHLTGLDDGPPLPTPQLSDWPQVENIHPTYWQVHRVEVVAPGLMRYVLIAQCRTEDEAFRVSTQQLHQVRITRWRDRRPPYFSGRPPRGA